MLKRLAILVFLLAIVQALDPAPRRATTSARNSGSNDKNSSQGNQNTASPMPPLVTPQVKTVSANPHGCDVAAETTNTEHSVRITGIPSIAITDIHKPWWEYFLDWGQWVFAGLLAFVGWQQVRLLRRQEKILFGARKEIHTQARHMSRQADLMNRNNVITLATARAANESAKAANAQIKIMKDKERARMMVNVIRLETLTFGEDGNQIIIQFENIGPTQAQNVRANGTAKVVIRDFDPSDLEPFDVGEQEIAPQDVIRANRPPVETYLVFFIPEKWGDDLVYMERRILIEMRGVVEYEDIFGDQHTTPLNYDMRIPKIVKWRGNNVAEVHPMGQWREVVLADGNRAT
jgi:hypothetical protein